LPDARSLDWGPTGAGDADPIQKEPARLTGLQGVCQPGLDRIPGKSSDPRANARSRRLIGRTVCAPERTGTRAPALQEDDGQDAGAHQADLAHGPARASADLSRMDDTTY